MTGEGIVVALAVMTMGTEGLLGVLLIEVAVNILLGAHLMVEGQGGKGLGHLHILHMGVQTGNMPMALGKVAR